MLQRAARTAARPSGVLPSSCRPALRPALPRPAAARPPSAFSTAASPAPSPAATPAPAAAAPTPTGTGTVAGTAPAAAAAPNTHELDFDDVSQSFSVKSEWEIWRSMLVFRLCAVRPLVRHARLLLTVGERVLGRRLTHALLRATFFGHFCAGETDEEVARVIERLERSGLGGILDYAAEADVAAVPAPPLDAGGQTHPGESVGVVPRDRTGIQSARTYDYASEAECDANARVCARCIEAAGARGDGEGFAAIKLTALGKPELLEHLSKILTETKKLFVAFATDPAHADAALDATATASAKATAGQPAAAGGTSSANPHPSISVSKLISFPHFLAGLRAIHVEMDEARARRLFGLMDRDSSGAIDYLEWVSFLDPKLLGGLAPHFRSEGLPTLAQDELEKVWAMIARLERLAELAALKRVRLMVDAEQSYFQPAIDHLVLHLQRKYNRDGAAVIFNTYQCYLRDSHSRLLLDLERSRREGFTFAAKAVRGAYMIQERKRAKEMGYEDPIHPNLQATHDNYHAVVSTLLSHSPQAHVMVATHNERTVRLVTELMAARGLPRRGGGVFFGQLLGMCDHVSFSLGRCGFAVYKYVPYGPIHDVLPYLIRRAEENSDMLGGAGKERRLLWNELKRRYRAKLGAATPAPAAIAAASKP